MTALTPVQITRKCIADHLEHVELNHDTRDQRIVINNIVEQADITLEEATKLFNSELRFPGLRDRWNGDYYFTAMQSTDTITSLSRMKYSGGVMTLVDIGNYRFRIDGLWTSYWTKKQSYMPQEEFYQWVYTRIANRHRSDIGTIDRIVYRDDGERITPQ